VRPDERATFAPEDNVIAGNVVGYGATSGEIFVNGIVGERFCVRNSGATVVVEGVGDHGCEYMTGGVAVVLGATGRNFAAGMSGGVAFVRDVDGTFASRVNGEMVDLVELTKVDAELLRGIVERHALETSSPLATRLLASWSESSATFRKVMPRDYARVLAVLDKAKAEGLDEEATAHRVMESVRG
jgi:glutamate synthase (NADPH/NADH) large chain